MKLLILGKGGMLGDDLAQFFADKYDTVITGKAECNICDATAVTKSLEQHTPDVVINCAAMANVDQCEREPEQARMVNGEAPGIIAAACNKTGAKLVHVSTDYVFAGTQQTPYTEDDPVDPISHYSESKELGEQKVRQNLDNHVIIRVAWVFGYKDKSFVRFVLRQAQQPGDIPIIHEQTGSVSYTIDIGRGIDALLQHDCRGTYHLTNEGTCTRFEFAQEILRLTGNDVTRLQPISSEKLNWIAKRPLCLILSKDKLWSDTGFRPQHWKQALIEYLQENQNGQKGIA